MRQYTFMDHLLGSVDLGLRSLFSQATPNRATPAADVTETELSDSERRLAGRLMRVNHAGEIAAQGLYQGQALTARESDVRERLDQAAEEEIDHLRWCEQRCHECGVPISRLGPFWYAGSLTIGALAGAAGDKWSLGFLAETEHQVVEHLNSHLQRLPENDEKSRAVVEQMRSDEGEHAAMAEGAGGQRLPYPVRIMMRLSSKVMTSTAYWI